jgi:threonine dehydrogenase-like Zn-dependent dehydrogenase
LRQRPLAIPRAFPQWNADGHEAIGVVEEVGSEVRSIDVGDVVLMPFAYSHGVCAFCKEGLHTACKRGGFFGIGQVDGAQAEALRAPLADGTLFVLGRMATAP